MRKTHISYVECPDEDWVMAEGGRCYRESQLRSQFVEMVQCPVCPVERWFSSEQNYRQHWHGAHGGV